jgi:hypothetical protein
MRGATPPMLLIRAVVQQLLVILHNELKPHRVRYYLEQRDTQFDRKMAEVLML